MAKGDVITRKDIIQDDALNWGPEYAEQMKIAIKKNEEFLKGIKDIVNAQKGIKGADNNSSYLKAKEEERLAFIKNMNAIREQAEAEKQLEKIKQEFAKTAKAEIEAQNKLEASKRRNTTQTIEERVAQQAENKVLRQAALEKLGLVSAYDKLNKSRTEAKKKLRDLIATEDASTESIKKAQKEFDALDGKVKKADDAVRDFTKNVGNYPKLNQFVGGLKNLVAAFGLVGGISAVASVVKEAARTVREYEAELVNLAAIAGKSRKEIAPLENEIRAVAKSSINSATEVAKLTTALVKLGATPEQAIGLLKPVNDLSIALRADAEQSAELVKGILNAYNEDVDQAARFTDVLAASANKSALSFEGLKNSFSYVAPAANAMGYSIEKTAAMLSVLVDNNIKAESAGRLLRTMLGQVAEKGTTLEAELEKISNSTDKMKTATMLFGSEGATLGIILSNNKNKVAELTKEYENAAGSLQELTDKQLQSVDAKIKILSSTWEEFILSIESGNGPISKFFIGAIEWATSFIKTITLANKGIEDFKKEARAAGEKNSAKVVKDGVNEYIKQLQRRNEEARKAGKQLAYTEDELYNERVKKTKEYAEKDLNILKLKLYEAQKSVKAFQSVFDEEEKQSNSLFAIFNIADYVKSKKNLDNVNLDIERYEGSIKGLENLLLGSNEKIITSEKEVTKTTEEDIAKRKKARDEYLKNLQKSESDAFNLMKFRLEQEIEISNDIADNEEETADTRIDAYLNAQQVEIALAKETAKRKLEEISKYNDGIRDLSSSEIQTLLNGGEIKKKLTDDEILVLEEYAAKQKEIDDRIAKNKQAIIDSIVKIEEGKTAKVLQSQDTELNKKLLRENQGFQDTLNTLGDNQKAIEDATKDHEARILNIKKEAIKEALQEEINATKKLLENTNLSADIKADLLNKLSKLELELNQISVNSSIDTNEKKLLSEEEYVDKIKELSEGLAGALADLTNALYDAKIQKIDEDIAKNDEYYAKQIESAGNDSRQKELLEVEAEKKRQVLEKKKRKEQTKQAIFNKALNITEIGLKTAQAVVAALAVGPPQGYVFAALSAVLGAAQLAAAIATPIPKYKMGRKGGKEEFAIVGDGGVNEIIERKSGKLELTPATDTLVKLYEGDSVHSSAEEFNRLKKASFMSSLSMENKKISDYEAMKHFDKNLLDSKIENAITNGFKKAKNNIVVNVPKQDIDHELWKSNFGNFKR